eukprot:13027012-Heterocapsa_arctica.AAC.1
MEKWSGLPISLTKATNVAESLDKSPDQENDDKCTGVSSQKRVRLRAEQLFQEGAAKKAARNQELLDIRQFKTSKLD